MAAAAATAIATSTINMKASTLSPMRRNQKIRRRQRSVSVPQTVLVSIASVLLVALIYPKEMFSWTPPIVTRKIRMTGSGSLDDHIRRPRRSFLLESTEQSTEDSLGSTGAIFSSTQLSSSLSPSLSSKPEVHPSLSAPTSPSIHEIAIVLNTNAKGVTEDLIDTARDVVKQWDRAQEGKKVDAQNPKVHLLVTSTYDEARSASRKIMATTNAAYSTTTLVIPVGGDGTLTAMINLLWEEHRSISNRQTTEDSSVINGNGIDNYNNKSVKSDSESNSKFPIVFGYVAMGTGNALGSVVGCLPVTKNQGNRRRKRRRILRLVRKCFRPQTTKREDFRLVLSQLIDAVSQTNTKSEVTGKQSQVPQPDPIEVDIVDLPMIRVRTTGREIEGQSINGTNGISPNGNAYETKNDRYAFFAGLGYDSLLLQDYKDLQDWTATKNKGSLWQIATTGVVGYTVAMFTKSLPKLLKLEDAARLLRDVKITTTDPGSAYWIDHRRGDTMRPVFPSTHHAWDNVGEKTNSDQDESTLLYRGSAGIVATGTVPYYGGGLRLFPFARMTPCGMHLRVGRELHPLEGVSRIPSIFEGSFRDKSTNTFKCLDFVGNQFTVEIYESYKYNGEVSSTSQETEEGFPVQHSGESMGRCTLVEFTVSSSSEVPAKRQGSDQTLPATKCEDSYDIMPPPMRFVTLMPPRIVQG